MPPASRAAIACDLAIDPFARAQSSAGDAAACRRMVPTSCRRFGQDHAAKQMLRAKPIQYGALSLETPPFDSTKPAAAANPDAPRPAFVAVERT
jgi:hypothetical protein